jgi:hypothetical protein
VGLRSAVVHALPEAFSADGFSVDLSVVERHLAEKTSQFEAIQVIAPDSLALVTDRLERPEWRNALLILINAALKAVVLTIKEHQRIFEAAQTAARHA